MIPDHIKQKYPKLFEAYQKSGGAIKENSNSSLLSKNPMQYILEHSEYIQLIDKSKVREPIMKFSNALIKEISVTKQFGDSPEVSIRRKILEDAIHTLWAELGI